MLWLRKFGKTSPKKNVGMTPCQKPDTRRHCEVYRIESMNNLPQPRPLPTYISVLGDCRRLLHALNPTHTVPSFINSFWHSVIPTSFFDFYILFAVENLIMYTFSQVFHSKWYVGEILFSKCLYIVNWLLTG